MLKSILVQIPLLVIAVISVCHVIFRPPQPANVRLGAAIEINDQRYGALRETLERNDIQRVTHYLGPVTKVELQKQEQDLELLSMLLQYAVAPTLVTQGESAASHVVFDSLILDEYRYISRQIPEDAIVGKYDHVNLILFRQGPTE